MKHFLQKREMRGNASARKSTERSDSSQAAFQVKSGWASSFGQPKALWWLSWDSSAARMAFRVESHSTFSSTKLPRKWSSNSRLNMNKSMVPLLPPEALICLVVKSPLVRYPQVKYCSMHFRHQSNISWLLKSFIAQVASEPSALLEGCLTRRYKRGTQRILICCCLDLVFKGAQKRRKMDNRSCVLVLEIISWYCTIPFNGASWP